MRLHEELPEAKRQWMLDGLELAAERIRRGQLSNALAIVEKLTRTMLQYVQPRDVIGWAEREAAAHRRLATQIDEGAAALRLAAGPALQTTEPAPPEGWDNAI